MSSVRHNTGVEISMNSKPGVVKVRGVRLRVLMGDQMEKKMEDETEAMFIQGL